METEVRGRAVLPALARIYPQLYLVPGTDSAALYDDVVLRGEDAPTRSLAHFTMDDGDSLVYESTPAGEVPVITLRCRADFELFLQIMACRCTPKPIPRTQVASTLDGVVNWTKIRAHKARFLLAQGDGADWEAEFKRFTSDRANYRDVLIVLSEGPYSAVPAQRAGYPESEWLRLSHTIRKTHECTHVLCRRLFPDKKDAVWDELVADAAGIAAALGRYDWALSELFLGIEGERYVGGRLENYVPEGEDRAERLSALAGKIHNTLLRFEAIAAERPAAGPYDLAIRLEEEIECWNQP